MATADPLLLIVAKFPRAPHCRIPDITFSGQLS